MNNIVKQIQEMFFEEATNSPLLFIDLARLEKYISESYSGRSLIELLQNADDARATRFYIKKNNENSIIIANNGLCFSETDLLSLCRSGTSAKKRGSNTIGYRGIGFKSIVNYANIVHLVSGDIKATFSRQLTTEHLSELQDVPLIRIPHDFQGKKYWPVINDAINKGYTTIFVFETSNNALFSEINNFNQDCLLFLRNIKEVCFDIDEKLQYNISRSSAASGYLITSINDDTSDYQWLIKSNEDNSCAVSFRFDGLKAIEADDCEAVVHSFMPTQNALSFKIKVNGDFSTDPSRTRITMDAATIQACNNCAKIITDILTEVIDSGRDQYCVVDILKHAEVSPFVNIRGDDPNDIIVKELTSSLQSYMYNKYGSLDKIRLQPNSIDDQDFVSICEKISVNGIGYQNQRKIPGLIELFKAIGIAELTSEDCLRAMHDSYYSDRTSAMVLSNLIKETQMNIPDSTLQLVRHAKIFKTQVGMKSIGEMIESDRINNIYESMITEHLPAKADLTSFIRRIGLDPEKIISTNDTHQRISSETQLHQSPLIIGGRIKKWRSVEMAVVSVIEQMVDIASVLDVSEQNIGYDIEAITKNGKKRFYEVKSVTKIGEPISVSNNEYSTGVQYGDDYYLAIACQGISLFEVCFINNPMNNLILNKRITRWDWLCNEYAGELVAVDIE